MTAPWGAGIARLRAVDSHTAGEPTRVIIEHPCDLGRGAMADRLAVMRERYDWVRRACVLEPRGSDVFVGAMLTFPEPEDGAFGAIFFNNVGYLGMCGHGTIGIAATLRHLGLLSRGVQRLRTPVGDVRFEALGDGSIRIENVASYRHARDVTLDVPSLGRVRGDIAWGGNWFFLVREPEMALRLADAAELTSRCVDIRRALDATGVTGAGGATIDHVELFAPGEHPEADSKNFVLCPGGAYDRSPCGTGTSAKVACLAEDGMLGEGEPWVQESIVGGLFTASYRRVDGAIVPTITGRAHVNAELTILLDPDDPFACGIGSG